MKDNTIDLSITIRGNDEDSVYLAQSLVRHATAMSAIYQNANIVISYKK